LRRGKKKAGPGEEHKVKSGTRNLRDGKPILKEDIIGAPGSTGISRAAENHPRAEKKRCSVTERAKFPEVPASIDAKKKRERRDRKLLWTAISARYGKRKIGTEPTVTRVRSR